MPRTLIEKADEVTRLNNRLKDLQASVRLSHQLKHAESLMKCLNLTHADLERAERVLNSNIKPLYQAIEKELK